jgi:hypothetical protein
LDVSPIVDPFVREARHASVDDQESDTARSVYCPDRSGLLYSGHSSLNSTILRVIENRARVLGSNLQPLHPHAGSCS